MTSQNILMRALTKWRDRAVSRCNASMDGFWTDGSGDHKRYHCYRGPYVVAIDVNAVAMAEWLLHYHQHNSCRSSSVVHFNVAAAVLALLLIC
jgi:hypothetical protein